jgi:RNA polymerase sigma factor (sigma-70 family)
MIASSSSDEPSSIEPIPDWAQKECDDFFKQTWRVALYRARFLVGRDGAEDLMHDAYISALEAWTCTLHALAPAQRTAWIRTTITHKASDRRRHDAVCERYMAAQYDPSGDRCADPAEAVVAAVAAATCLKAIGEMPRDLRVMAVMYWVDGFTQKEIADILKRPPGTVGRKLKEARDQMYRLVGIDLPFEPKFGKGSGRRGTR